MRRFDNLSLDDEDQYAANMQRIDALAEDEETSRLKTMLQRCFVKWFQMHKDANFWADRQSPRKLDKRIRHLTHRLNAYRNGEDPSLLESPIVRLYADFLETVSDRRQALRDPFDDAGHVQVDRAFARLGLSRALTTGPAQVEHAARKLLLKCHPDKLVGQPDEVLQQKQQEYEEIRKAKDTVLAYFAQVGR